MDMVGERAHILAAHARKNAGSALDLPNQGSSVEGLEAFAEAERCGEGD